MDGAFNEISKEVMSAATSVISYIISSLAAVFGGKDMSRIRPLVRLLWISLCIAGTVGIVLVVVKRIELYCCGFIILIYTCAGGFGLMDSAIGRDERLAKMSEAEREKELLKLKEEKESYYRSRRKMAGIELVMGIILYIILSILSIMNNS